MTTQQDTDETPDALSTLRQRDQWVAWEDREGRKIPINPHGGGYASATDRMTWGSFERAVRCYDGRNLTGVGFVLSDDDPFAGIDLDNCLRDGVLNDEAREIVEWVDSYTEVSPSGTGVKIWCRDPRGVIGRAYKQKGVEVYESRRYFTVTARHWGGTPPTIEPASSGLGWLVETHCERDHRQLGDGDLSCDGGGPDDFPVDPDEWVVDALESIDPDCPYDQWVGVGMALHHDLGDGAFDLWDDWSSGGDKYEPGEMQNKWQSFESAPGRAKSIKYVWWLAEQYGWQWEPETDEWLDAAGGVEPKPYRPETERQYLEGADDGAAPKEGPAPGEGATQEAPLQLFDYAETYRDDSPYEPDLVSPGVLGGGDLAMIFGPPKSMKTFATAGMCRQWAMGGEWIDMEASRPLTTVYLNFELKRDRWRQRSHMVDLSDEELDALQGQFFYTERFLATMSREFLEQCVDSVALQVDGSVDLLVVDPVANFFPGDNESDNQQVSEFIRQVRRLASSLDQMGDSDEECATLLVHHAAKSEYDQSFSNIRGASAFRGAYDTGLYIYPDEDGRTVHMEREARNASDLGDLHLGFDGDEGRFFEVGAVQEGPTSERHAGAQQGQQWDAEHKRKARAVLEILQHEAKRGVVYTKSDFAETWGSNSKVELGSSSSVHRLVSELLAKQLLAYFDAADYGGPAKHGNSDGHLCCEEMVMPADGAKNLEEAQGVVEEVEPEWFVRPGHPEPVHVDRLDDPRFADLAYFFPGAE